MRARRLPDAAGLQLEGVLLAGGLRAVLLQLAHPAVGHGVAQHSDFAHDPMKRLTGTLAFVYVVSAGEEPLVRRVAREVGGAHRDVVGSDPAPYDARDPRLQLWVAATIHDTALRIAEAVWGRLPDALADELLLRNGRIATVLGLPQSDWPTDRAAFDAVFAGLSRELAFDASTLAVVRALFRAEATPLWMRLAVALLARATVPTLPALAPELAPLVPGPPIGLLPLARRLAPAWRLLPASLRRLPARRILAAARRSR